MNYLKYTVAAAALSLSLSGCGLYSKFESPKDAVPADGLYSYIQATNDTSNIASLPWRTLFVDAHLQRLIEKALQNNTDLSVARLDVEQAQAALKTARLAPLPTLSATPQGTISDFKSSTTKSYNLSVSSSWEIDIFAKLRNAKESSKAALEQSVAYRQAVQTQLIATVATSYYSLLMLDEQLKISEETQKNWDENLRVMEALKRAGRINETSVLQSKSSSVALKSQIVTIKEQLAALENTLCALLAMPTTHIERGEISQATFPKELSIGVPMELLTNRPDIRMAESLLAQRFYNVAEARSSLYPTLTLSGAIGFTNSSGAVTNPGDLLSSVVGSLVQPIFSHGTLQAQLKISKAQQEQALLEFKQAILDAGAEVNSALSSWQSAQARLKHSEEQIDLLKLTVKKTELLMKHGEANSLEVLTSQLSLLQSELSYAEDKFNEAQGVINLYRSLGGGE
ncbi:MAG: TolC family protein [Rikenellaceae bacterium]